MSFGKGPSSEPQFFGNQVPLAEKAIDEIARRVLGGGPSPVADQRAAREREGIIQESRRAGFSEKDPITQRKLASVAKVRQQTEAAQETQLLQFLLSPQGAASGGGFNVGLGK